MPLSLIQSLFGDATGRAVRAWYASAARLYHRALISG